jgi:hypothetical protein
MELYFHSHIHLHGTASHSCYKFLLPDVAVDSMVHLQSQGPLASVATAKVGHVMNILVSACSVVVTLGVGGVSIVSQTIMGILHKPTASVSCKYDV